MSYENGMEVLAADEVLGARQICEMLGISGDFAEDAVHDGYRDAMIVDALAGAVADRVFGGEAADVALPIIATIAKAGGEYASQTAASRAQGQADTAAKAALLSAGEAAWGRMKRAAEAAKWPQDISPRVVLIDKTWQASKHSGDQATVQRLIEEMNALAMQIEARLGGGYAPPQGYAPPRATSIPGWVKAVGGLALVGGVGLLGYKALKK